ncbi:MAG: carbohydrate kinase family protein [Fervidobacterium sp.]
MSKPGWIKKFLTIEKAIEKLLNFGIEELFRKLGAKGSLYANNNERIYKESFKIVSVDTTGAGNSFIVCVIFSLLHNNPPTKILRFSNACAALTCLKRAQQVLFRTSARSSYFLTKM